MKAKLIKVLTNSSPFKEGFFEIPLINDPNNTPNPLPTPAKDIVAKPAPINFWIITYHIYLLYF